ncbi:YihY/virulence factor BrkB family protein [Microbacterium sp. M28]|uniref:YihY/virulence factor BrkB family protein n=1 Tax=Microbacterium sp. M28 TaxID=2962064 RepID=UPI0021F4BB5D|nr:YihY/virulence factor BrkB family protein [Microbacterium sp. M28]UYO96117.1 YihY/virulence factor BrkB family protein [Microbacterium sp. M28]
MSRPESTPTPSGDARAQRGAADVAAREEQHLRARWEQTQDTLRERFEDPISRATELTHRTLEWFPVRVWRNFLQHEGFLLAAGVSYQALFAGFAAVYVAFAIAGIWLGGSTEAIDGLIDVINNYIPGLIVEGGVITPEQVEEIAGGTTGTFSVTGAIALGALIWTAVGAISFARRAVRGVFGIPPDRRNYFLLKSRDFLGAIVFGAGLMLGTLLGTLGTWALEFAFRLIGLGDATTISSLTVRLVTIGILYVVNTVLLAGLFRFLTGTQLTWRRIMPGAFLGAAATTVLQLGFGLFLGYTPSNPLLATFTVFIVMLLWFRLIGIVLLVAASWIAVAAQDNHIALLPQSEAERLAAEHRALLIAAQVRLRTAQEARATAPWYRIWTADRAVREAQDELEQVEAATPPPPPKRRTRPAVAVERTGAGTAADAASRSAEKDVRRRR